MAYKIELKKQVPITELSFPDITKLGDLDRNYDLIMKADRFNRPDLSPEETTSLRLRSQFFEDLDVNSIDEYFLTGKKERYYRERKTLVEEGAPRVLHAIRTHTLDAKVIGYRLDIQDDLLTNPGIIAAFGKFYTEALEAQAMHSDAYAKDGDGRIIVDQWGRYVFKNWANLPKSFAKLDKAIGELQEALGGCASQGMRDVLDFLQQVKDHPVYRGWTQHSGRVKDGGRYFLAFDYDPIDGARLTVQLGAVPKGSKLDKILSTPAKADGTIQANLDDKLTITRVTGIIRTEFGHLMQEITGLNFDNLGNFCEVLTKGMREQLSFYATLGHLYSQYEALGIPHCRPVFGKGDGIEIKETIHPTVAKNATDDGATTVFNDYSANSQSNGVVITGPNDGGKTCYGKAVGLDFALAQAGIRPPAKSFRAKRPVREIYTHFIVKEELKDGKGRHRNELVRARELCEILTPEDFLLYDEPCGGTDVRSGLNDSSALIRYASIVNVPFIFATHIHELAEAVEKGRFPGTRNMQAEIVNVEEGLMPTHRIIGGRAKESYGTRVSREVGITDDSLNRLLKARIASGDLDPSKLRQL